MNTLEFPSENESGPVSLEDTEEKLVVSAIGSISSFDVWMHVHRDWLTRVYLRAYGRVGLARVLLQEVVLHDVPATDDEGTHVAGIAISLRGQPMRAVEVTVQAVPGDPLSEGLFYLQAWHDQSPMAGAGHGDAGAPRPSFAARLVGKTESGEPKEVAVTSDGVVRTLGVRP